MAFTARGKLSSEKKTLDCLWTMALCCRGVVGLSTCVPISVQEINRKPTDTEPIREVGFRVPRHRILVLGSVHSYSISSRSTIKFDLFESPRQHQYERYFSMTFVEKQLFVPKVTEKLFFFNYRPKYRSQQNLELTQKHELKSNFCSKSDWVVVFLNYRPKFCPQQNLELTLKMRFKKWIKWMMKSRN